MGTEPDDPLAIPQFLKRNSNNRAEFMSMAETEQVGSRPAKTVKAVTKPNGKDKPAAKVLAKPEKAKPVAKAKVSKAPPKVAKGSEKPKVAKAKSEGVKKDVYGFREGSAKSKAVAMYATKSGATLEEVKEAVGSIQLNCLNSLEAEGYQIVKKKEEREGARPVTRYFLKGKAK